MLSSTCVCDLALINALQYQSSDDSGRCMVLYLVATLRQIRRNPCYALTLFHTDEVDREREDVSVGGMVEPCGDVFPYAMS